MSYVTFSRKTAISILILVAIIAFYLFINSPYFETEIVEWTGLVYLDQEQLDAYLAFTATNVWRLDTGELEDLLLEHPWIKDAKISWRWPNRIIISLQERVPLAQIPHNTGWLLLDGEGNLLPPTQGGLVYPLPLITNLELGAREQLRATARLIAMIPPSLKHSVSEWNVVTRCFITRMGTEILLGPAEELEEKFILLEKIMDDLVSNNEKAKKIDLRVPTNPVVTIL